MGRRGALQAAALLVCVDAVVLFGRARGALDDCRSELQNVNMFLGTGGLAYGYGALNPAAQYPFGGLRLGPDTASTIADISYRHFSGYNPQDDKIRAFSHTHLVGAGINNLGNFGLMPVRRQLTSLPHSWWSVLDKATEKAVPGQYSVFLSTAQVQVDLLATSRWTALHRYTWMAAAQQSDPHARASVIVDVCHAAKISDGLIGDGGGLCSAASITIAADGQSFDAEVHFSSDGVSAWLHGAFTGAVAGAGRRRRQVQGWETCFAHGGCSHDVGTTHSGSGVLFAAASLGPLLAADSDGDGDGGGDGDGDGGGGRDVTVEVRVGLSFISAAQAQLNFAAVFGAASSDSSDSSSSSSTSSSDSSSSGGSSGSFEALRAASERVWCAELSTLQTTAMEGGHDGDDPAVLEAMMATMHYHSRMSPTNLVEAGGVYRGLDGQLHNAEQERAARYDPLPPITGITGSDGSSSSGSSSSSSTSGGGGGDEDAKSREMGFYSDLSLWDTFRTQHPWLLLTDERLGLGIVRTLGEMTAQQSGFPRWVLLSRDISCMVGLHGAAAVNEALSLGWGQKQFDAATIYSFLLRQLTEPDYPVNGRADVDFYLQHGYVAQETSDVSPSLTATYAFDDWLLARMAALLGQGDSEAAQAAQKRAYNIQNIWNATQGGFLCARDKAGTLACPPTPVSPQAWQENIEGDAYHWGYFFPQDPAGHIARLYPSSGAFVQSLDAYFVAHEEAHKKLGSPVPNPYYWAGNEISAFTAMLFSFAAGYACLLTQKWTRRLTEMHYR